MAKYESAENALKRLIDSNDHETTVKRERVPPGAMTKAKRPEIEDPKTLVSALKNTFPESTEADWNYYDPVGWIHTAEEPSFRAGFATCAVTGSWAHKQSMKYTTHGFYITKEEAKANWIEDQYLNRWFRTADEAPHTAYDSKGKKIVVSESTLSGNFRIDSIDGRWFPSDFMHKTVHAQGAEQKYSYVSKFSVEKNPNLLAKCPRCGKIIEHGVADLIPSQGLCEQPRICHICFNELVKHAAIKAHNATDYPPPLFTHVEMVRKVKGTGVDGIPAKFKKIKTPPLRLYGVELEVEVKGSNWQEQRVPLAISARQLLGRDFVICKHDGSLAEGGKRGFEIVTCPADMQTHKDRWKKLEDTGLHEKFKAWDTDTCGMHVHVSRASITTLQLGRMLVFVNHPGNKKFIAKIAGRSETEYCKYREKRPIDALEGGRGRADDAGRRQAINQQNKHTIEFRIFRGTVRYRHIVRNLEFVDAFCQFCHPGSRSFKDLFNWPTFVDFVDERRREWPLIAEWMAAHEYIKLGKVDLKKADPTKLTVDPSRAVEVGAVEKQQPKTKMTFVHATTTNDPDTF